MAAEHIDLHASLLCTLPDLELSKILHVCLRLPVCPLKSCRRLPSAAAAAVAAAISAFSVLPLPASCLCFLPLLPASCFLLPASCFLLPASCLPAPCPLPSPAILQCLRNVLEGDAISAGEISDGARDAQDAIEGTRGEAKLFGCVMEQPRAARVERADGA